MWKQIGQIVLKTADRTRATHLCSVDAHWLGNHESSTRWLGSRIYGIKRML